MRAAPCRRSLGSSLAEDEALLAGKATPKRAVERAALTFRIEKKKVLSALLANLGVPGAASRSPAAPSAA